MPTDAEPQIGKQAARFPIVGIGASAGGLEAFLAFLSALPSRTGMAYIFFQHLEPHHESYLPEILSRATQMPVEQAQNGTFVERDRLYVAPPNAVLTIENGALRLSPRTEGATQYYPIDQFFFSRQGSAESGDRRHSFRQFFGRRARFAIHQMRRRHHALSG